MDAPQEGKKTLASVLMADIDRISIDTVKAFYLPHEPSLQALVDDYENRTAQGERLCIYLAGNTLIVGPPPAEGL